MQLEMACISGKQDCGALHKISTDTVPKREAKRIVLAVVDGWSLWRSSWAVLIDSTRGASGDQYDSRLGGCGY